MTVNKKNLFRYSFSLILSEFSESVLLFSGVFLFAFDNGEAIGVIGLMDTFLLCCFAIGNALCDSYHNFYSRAKQGGRLSHAKTIFHRSVPVFLKQGFQVFAVTAFLGILLSGIMSSESIQIFLQSLPLLLILVLIFFAGLSHHALLVGMGELKTVGILALVTIFLNTGLILGMQQLAMEWLSPVHIVLLAGIISEIVWLILLKLKANRLLRGVISSYQVSVRFDKVIRKAAILPGISVFLFFLFTYLFMGYLTIYYPASEVTYFSMAFALWSVMMAPANGVYEAALHLFSQEWASGNNMRFFAIQRGVTALSFLLSLAMFLGLGWILVYTMPGDGYLWWILGLMPILALLNSQTKFGFLSLFVKLRLGVFAQLKSIYAILVFSILGMGYLFFEVNTLALLISMVLAQGVVSLLLIKGDKIKNVLLPNYLLVPVFKNDFNLGKISVNGKL